MTFAPDRAVFRRIDFDIEVRTEIVVSPEDAAELRRVSVTNHSGRPRIARPHELRRGRARAWRRGSRAPGLQQPVRRDDGGTGTRRADLRAAAARGHRPLVPRSRRSAVAISPDVPTEFETDRARFIGRGRTLERPAGDGRANTLSGTSGPVLDPIVSLRQSTAHPARRHRPPVVHDRRTPTARKPRARLIDKYHDRRAVARALALASTHSQVELRHLGLTPEDTMRFQRLAGRLLYGDPRLRAQRCRPEEHPHPGRTLEVRHLRRSPDSSRPDREDSDVALFRELSEGARVPATQGTRLRSRRP